MIDLMPNMWLTTMHDELEEDDIHEYGRLVIDIPDTPDSTESTIRENETSELNGYSNRTLRGVQPTPVTEKETSSSASSMQSTTNPTKNKHQKVSPLRINRNIPIKLLLKRSFQNSRKLHNNWLKVDKTDNEEQNLSEFINGNTKELLTHGRIPKQVQTQEKTDGDNSIVNEVHHRISPQNCITKQHNTLNGAIQSHKEKISHKPYLNGLPEINVQSVADNQIYTKIKEKYKPNVQIQSSTISQSQLEHKQRISVVSNEFLFRHRSKRETLGIPSETISQSPISSDQTNPQLYQEALIDFMERQYQIAVRENIPAMVNKNPFQEPLKEKPDSKIIELINIDQRTYPHHLRDVTRNAPSDLQINTNFAIQNKYTPVAVQNSSNLENQPGYNILVQRGPDINRIVITIANEKEEKTNTINQSFNGDQRVPESVNNTSYSEASPPSRKKRSYYYKEPSLRSFRKRSPHKRAQKQIKNTTENNRFDPTDHPPDNHNNVAFPQLYSYLGNQYEVPTPLIRHYYPLGVERYSIPVTNAFCPWELHDERPISSDSDRNPRRRTDTMTNIPFNEKQCHLESHKEQIVFGPLNLSMKPRTVDKISYPENYSRYPLPVQDY